MEVIQPIIDYLEREKQVFIVRRIGSIHGIYNIFRSKTIAIEYTIIIAFKELVRLLEQYTREQDPNCSGYLDSVKNHRDCIKTILNKYKLEFEQYHDHGGVNYRLTTEFNLSEKFEMLRDANRHSPGRINSLFYIEVANLANNSNMEYTPELIPLEDLLL